MKAKRLWMWSVMFGIVSSLLIYQLIAAGTGPTPVQAETPTATDETAPENVAATKTSTDMPEMLHIAEGKGAISLPVTTVQGVSGFIQPGSHVDLIATTTLNGVPAASLLASSVKVLAVDQQTDATGQPGAYTSITVEVAPEQGVQLAQALQQGTVTAMLRHRPVDAEKEENAK